MKLAQHYGDKPAAELPMLFQRILSNTTLDWFRRRKTRNALFSNLSEFSSAGDDGDFDLLETLESLTNSEGTESAQDATERAETAAVMGCSEGSVKTHCSRAVHALSKALSAKGIKL